MALGSVFSSTRRVASLNADDVAAALVFGVGEVRLSATGVWGGAGAGRRPGWPGPGWRATRSEALRGSNGCLHATGLRRGRTSAPSASAARDAARVAPDFVADRDEIGAGGHKRGDLVGAAGKSDAGHREQFGPPLDAIDDGLERRTRAPRLRSRRTSRSPRLVRRRVIASSRLFRPPQPAMRAGLRLSTAARNASIPVRCAPSAPARAAISACPSSTSAVSLSCTIGPAP